MRMNTRTRTTLQTMKKPSNNEKAKDRMETGEKGTSKRCSSKERKLALQQDVDKLRKKLRHEENVHRALERAFTRPLGALPRLPPYLPPYTLELLAEVAVLEEEVVRLEEQVVNFRQGLYQEAVYISSSSKKQMENPSFSESCSYKPEASSISRQSSLDAFSDRNPKPMKQQLNKRGLSETGSPNAPKITRKHNTFEDGHGKENQLIANSSKTKRSPQLIASRTRPSSWHPNNEQRSSKRCLDLSNSKGPECDVGTEEVVESIAGFNGVLVIDQEIMDPNRISEEILRCLLSIFLKLTRSGSGAQYDDMRFPISKPPMECSQVEARDPYGICSEAANRDIGPYKHLNEVITSSIDMSRLPNSSFMMRRLKVLLGKLGSVDLSVLNHQQKLAFWINIYNSCMMHAYLEHGIPDSPQMVVALMRKATMKVGGHLLNALTIEHFILRLPYHSKFIHLKGAKADDLTMRNIFGLEWADPMVTFALSCGSWSSPAVRVYAAANVEEELEAAKRDYLQAAVGICWENKLVIPKLLDWYQLDFAKDADSLLDWICLQLPTSVRKEALKCLEKGRKDSLSKPLLIMPYDFSFRYLFSP
ncbi:uncharacterized protein LOC18421740 isoform X2 [Amborella trichopoda]|nr:uncharacterized protein LOC18421740 isoform X2 [Amborella trichopoda]|eukprot:XP_011620320.2 uncharacterized protein LOC18421740 isoform X2 [Amborella trichopoda]